MKENEKKAKEEKKIRKKENKKPPQQGNIYLTSTSILINSLYNDKITMNQLCPTRQKRQIPGFHSVRNHDQDPRFELVSLRVIMA